MADLTSVVETSCGPVQGFIDTHHLADKSTSSLPPGKESPVQKYLGVPVGQAQRWSQAGPADKWTAVRKCHEFGPSCPQPPGVITEVMRRRTPGLHLRSHLGTSEADQFTVNVFSTVKDTSDAVPVMVWIYGGSWKTGSTCSDLYDPTELLRHAEPLVVVTLNYRVNLFGFLASRDLVDDEGLVGNYGLRDQVLALKWIKANIHKFGGNADNITIFGESAGATSVAYHVGGKDALFQRAICQSGAASTMSYQPLATHEKTWQLMLSHFHIDEKDPDRVAKARAIPAEALLDFQAAYPALQAAACIETGPNAIWDVHPDVRMARGEYPASIESLILGCTRDEGSIFTEAFGMRTAQPAVDKFVGALGIPSSELNRLYPGIQDVSSHKTGLITHPVSRMLHDAIFEGPVRLLAETASSVPNAQTGRQLDVYLYLSDAILPTWAELNWGAHHISEIPFVFNTSSAWQHDLSRPESRTALNFVKKWTAFASAGSPGSDWPKYTTTEKKRLVFLNDGKQQLQDVSEGVNQESLALMSTLLKHRWGIQDVKPESVPKM